MLNVQVRAIKIGHDSTLGWPADRKTASSSRNRASFILYLLAEMASVQSWALAVFFVFFKIESTYFFQTYSL